MPKRFDDNVRARAIALLVETGNSERAAERVAAENPGLSVSSQAVRDWASGLKLKLTPGRRNGDPGTRFSLVKAKIHACHDEGLTQTQTCIRLGLSRSLVSKHWPRASKAASRA